MQDYILSIPENNNKAKALLNYLKSIDFVKISKNVDWWETLSTEQKNKINKSVELLDSGEGIPHDKVRKNIEELLRKNA